MSRGDPMAKRLLGPFVTAMAVLATAAGGLHAQERLPNVADALETVSADSQLLRFTFGSTQRARGGHLQGIQIKFDKPKNRYVVFLSRDSETIAYLVIVEFPDLRQAGRVLHVHTFPSDGQTPPLRHAGGIQLLGDILAVGLEDNQEKTRSEVQLWDISSPEKPAHLKHLAVRRSGEPRDKTAGAVALIQRANDHLLAVANWDSRAVDFYNSNGKPLQDQACRFEHRRRWQDLRADKAGWQPDQVFGTYQAINLLADPSGAIFLLGFDTAASAGDVVDLFSVDVTLEPTKVLRKLARKPLKLQAENHFRFSGGSWLEGGRLVILSSPHDFGSETLLNIIR